MPATARWMNPAVGRSDLFRTDVNLKLGFEYLAYLVEYYEGDVRLALTAYNRGPGTVDRLLRLGRDPENGYADKVLGTESRATLRLLRRS
jgi:soluble lytic murein transglycosylase-like protein